MADKYLKGLEEEDEFVSAMMEDEIVSAMMDAGTGGWEENKGPRLASSNPKIRLADPRKDYRLPKDLPFDMTKFVPQVYTVETENGTIKDRPGSNYRGLAQLGKNERAGVLKQMGITDEDYLNNENYQRNATDLWFFNLVNRLKKNGFTLTPLNVWMAHNLGVEGMNQVLHNKVSEQTLKNIRNQKGMNKNSTVQDYIDYYYEAFK